MKVLLLRLLVAVTVLVITWHKKSSLFVDGEGEDYKLFTEA